MKADGAGSLLPWLACRAPVRSYANVSWAGSHSSLRSTRNRQKRIRHSRHRRILRPRRAVMPPALKISLAGRVRAPAVHRTEVPGPRRGPSWSPGPIRLGSGGLDDGLTRGHDRPAGLIGRRIRSSVIRSHVKLEIIARNSAIGRHDHRRFSGNRFIEMNYLHARFLRLHIYPIAAEVVQISVEMANQYRLSVSVRFVMDQLMTLIVSLIDIAMTFSLSCARTFVMPAIATEAWCLTPR